MGTWSTHTISKHKQTLFKVNSVHVYARIHAKKSQHIVRSAKNQQSEPTCSGFRAECSCRICMHTSGGRHLHWTQAVCAAHINVSVACEEHNMNTRQCHRHTSFLHHNKLITDLDAAEEETVFLRTEALGIGIQRRVYWEIPRAVAAIPFHVA